MNEYFTERHGMKLSVICFLVFLFLTMFHNRAAAQTDTIRIMSYNCMNYDLFQTDCPGNNDFKKKDAWLRTIVNYNKPDIVSLVEMNPSRTFMLYIRDSVLNKTCANCYDTCFYSNLYSASKAAMLFYRKEKFGFISTATVYRDGTSEDVNWHKLFYIRHDSIQSPDTTFLNILPVHLVSGSSADAQRASQTAGIMNYLNTHVGRLSNYIIIGDCNIRSSIEQGIQNLLNPANPRTRFYESTGLLGDYTGDPSSFTGYLTVSTTSSAAALSLQNCSTDKGSKGWYDHAYCSEYIMKETGNVKYINGSFTVTGQDGNRQGISVNDPPLNTSAPADVIDAVFRMSNHYPISLKLLVDLSRKPANLSDSIASGLTEIERDNSFELSLTNPVKEILHFTFSQGSFYSESEIRITDMSGRLLFTKTGRELDLEDIDVSYLQQGIYFVSFITSAHIINMKFIKE